ncbi:MAG: preprotein translocase subunit YajC [Pseudomonadota bacterium]
MLITPAYAQATGAPGGGDFIIQLIPFILIFVIMYFLILRPQQKRMKEHRDMIENIRRGDEIVTAGGIKGKVTRLNGDDELQVEIAENVRVKIVRGTVSYVVTKGEPVKDNS